MGNSNPAATWQQGSVALKETGLGRKISVPDKANPKVRQILAAAQALFLEKGYDAVTMDMVVDQARVSKATAYVHFAGKEALFATVMIDLTGLSGDEIWRLSETFGDIEIELDRLARNFMDAFLTRQAILFRRTIISAVTRFPSIGEAVFDSGPKIIVERSVMFMKAANASGQIAIPDAEMAAEQFLSLVRGFIDVTGMLSQEFPSERKINDNINSAVRIFLSYYRVN